MRYLLVFFFISHKNIFFIFIEYTPHLPRSALEENPFTEENQRSIISIFMLTIDGYIVFLGFRSQDNYSSMDREGYRSFLSMTDPTAIAI